MQIPRVGDPPGALLQVLMGTLLNLSGFNNIITMLLKPTGPAWDEISPWRTRDLALKLHNGQNNGGNSP